jgi:hypothetical protein
MLKAEYPDIPPRSETEGEVDFWTAPLRADLAHMW